MIPILMFSSRMLHKTTLKTLKIKAYPTFLTAFCKVSSHEGQRTQSQLGKTTTQSINTLKREGESENKGASRLKEIARRVKI